MRRPAKIALGIVLSGVAAFLVLGVAAASVVCGGFDGMKNACINNLRQIDGAKEQFTYDNQTRDGELLPAGEIAKYIKGAQIPKCPAGGDYTLGLAGAAPTCTVKGHTLNEIKSSPSNSR